ncbi:MAG: DNA (cytosine-5-)-methyltransferase [Kiritimatiellaeota bacterium]|nr:DNA (cytosine-5-)-methyltransferase [Kiritimatiellota bacterium]
MKNGTKKVLSLFSGCGGMDLGLEGGFEVLKCSIDLESHGNWLGKRPKRGDIFVKLKKNSFETVFANDIEKTAKIAWECYFSKRRDISGIYHLESVVDLVKRHKSGEKVFPNEIDVVTGGFPCNDFSLAGKRKGFDSHRTHKSELRMDEPSVESRGRLYMWMKEVIELAKPRMFIAENVKGLVSLGDAKKIIERDFREIAGGYVVLDARILRACDYGVPQKRDRVLFYGFRKDALTPKALDALSKTLVSSEFDPYPSPTHSRDVEFWKLPWTTTRDAFANLAEPEKSNDLSQRSYAKAKYLGRRCQGQIEVPADKPSPTIRAEHHGNIEYRRLSEEHGGTKRDELSAGLPERRLTVRECARLQSFPDDFEFVLRKSDGGKALGASSGYRVIGNAVPPLLAYHAARRLEEIWSRLFNNITENISS